MRYGQYSDINYAYIYIKKTDGDGTTLKAKIPIFFNNYCGLDEVLFVLRINKTNGEHS